MTRLQMLVIPGWSFDGSSLQEFLENTSVTMEIHIVDYRDIKNLEEIEAKAEEILDEIMITSDKLVICGWSLGSLVAMALARKYEQQIQGVILISGTPSFVKRENYPFGWDARVVKSMQRGLQRDKVATLQSFDKLIGVGEQHRESEQSIESLTAGLQYLIDTDNRELCLGMNQDVLIMHSLEDQVCIIAGARYIESKLGVKAVTCYVDGFSHAPFVTSSVVCQQAIESFLGRF